MKYLVVGLGNIGSEYANTRHNIGFTVLEYIAHVHNLSFKTQKLGDVCTCKHKGRTLILLKPSTYMNLSGKAVNYWLQQEKIPLEHLLVITDDLSLPFGTLRLRGQGSDGGHNGLKSIQEHLKTQNYARVRFGIGSNFNKGQQSNYVLGQWEQEERDLMLPLVEKAVGMIESFSTIGLALTMTQFNKKP